MKYCDKKLKTTQFEFTYLTRRKVGFCNTHVVEETASNDFLRSRFIIKHERKTIDQIAFERSRRNKEEKRRKKDFLQRKNM